MNKYSWNIESPSAYKEAMLLIESMKTDENIKEAMEFKISMDFFNAIDLSLEEKKIMLFGILSDIKNDLYKILAISAFATYCFENKYYEEVDMCAKAIYFISVLKEVGDIQNETILLKEILKIGELAALSSYYLNNNENAKIYLNITLGNINDGIEKGIDLNEEKSIIEEIYNQVVSDK